MGRFVIIGPINRPISTEGGNVQGKGLGELLQEFLAIGESQARRMNLFFRIRGIVIVPLSANRFMARFCSRT
jgi:hypothetical protein